MGCDPEAVARSRNAATGADLHTEIKPGDYFEPPPPPPDAPVRIY